MHRSNPTDTTIGRWATGTTRPGACQRCYRTVHGMTDARALPAAHPPRRGSSILLAALVAVLFLLANAGLVAASPAAGGLLASTRHRVMVPEAPPSLNLFHADAFRYQDPNGSACTSASTMIMLNVVAIRGTGSAGFRWKVDRTGAKRDAILAWSRDHHTMEGGTGTDPHGWRNALNHYGWGSGALDEDSRRYDDRAFSTYERAVRAAVRALVLTRKPVGVLAWAGRHAQVITGYYGLVGDPFKKTSTGAWADDFTVDGFYLSDPLKSAEIVNRRISWSSFKGSSNLGVRFRTYRETDSPYDDPYTAGVRASVDEWYGKYVLILPVR